jgi:REP element-mobilizing transposase RayT
MHAIWALPPDDANFSRRWSLIKNVFSRALPGDPNRSRSKFGKREKASDVEPAGMHPRLMFDFTEGARP